jgi:hypothetical protein
MKQLYFIAIEKLLDAGFHERFDSEGNPETQIWIESVKTWLTQKLEPIEGCQLRNNVKALLVLQGQQQMLNKLLEELVLQDKNKEKVDK